MNAPTPMALPLQLRDARGFEGFVLRAVLISAAAGILHAGMDGFRNGVPAWLFAGPALLLVAPTMTWVARTILGAVLVVGALVGLVLTTGMAMAVFFGAFAGVALFVVRRGNAQGSAEPTSLHATAAMFAGAFAVPFSEWVVARLWHARPPLLPFWTDAALVVADGLLLSLIALPLHLHAPGDVLLEEGGQVVRGLRGRFRALGDKVLDQARECRALFAALPRDKALTELETTFGELLTSSLHHLREWSGVDEELSDAAGVSQRTGAELERLRAEVESSKDAVVREHLAAALSALEEEVERSNAIAQSRQRALARLEAHAALLSRLKGALIGVKSGHAEVRSVELAALARKLSAQSASRAMEAEVMREVATGAELDQLAAARVRS